ncbi:MAG: hypothetical protein GYB66_05750 [Chloroflexi bacterium]|nr:hypothetical protein [Chloroflexota bacterium]
MEQLTTGEANSGIPVLVCSLENDTSRSANLGAAAHIIKPFVEADLIQAVQQANGETTSNGG